MILNFVLCIINETKSQNSFETVFPIFSTILATLLLTKSDICTSFKYFPPFNELLVHPINFQVQINLKKKLKGFQKHFIL